MIICLTGMPGSGKTTVADMLKQRGFTLIELSSQLKKLMSICGGTFDMKSREAFAANLKKAFGRDILAKLSAEEVKNAKGNVIISGVRSTMELDYIRTLNQNVAVIALSVPKDLRYNRLVKRKAGIRTSNYRDFEWRDRSNVAMGMPQAIHSADYTLVNTGTLTQLHSDIDELLRRIGSAKRSR